MIHFARGECGGGGGRGTPGLYGNSEKKTIIFVLQTRLPCTCPHGVPQSTVKQQTPSKGLSCFLAQGCHTGLHLCEEVEKWSPQHGEFHHYRFICLGFEGRAKGTFQDTGERGGGVAPGLVEIMGGNFRPLTFHTEAQILLPEQSESASSGTGQQLALMGEKSGQRTRVR